MYMYRALVTLAIALAVSARATPVRRQNAFDLANGQAAIALNEKFKANTAGGACDPVADANACVGDQFAQCVNGQFVAQACAPGTVCAALPLVNSPGTSVACTTVADRDARIAATGATGAAADGNAGQNNDNGNNGNNGQNNNNGGAADQGNNNAGNGGAAGNNGAQDGNGNNGQNNGGNEDPQTSLTLDPRVVSQGFTNDGQDVPAEGQVASLTSGNNFINFCLTVPDKQLTNGQQNPAGSCNTAPIGVIPSVDNMPSSKFTFPANQGTVPANQAFTITMAIRNLVSGNFVNAQANYFAAPQQLQNGQIVGHTHFVVESIPALDSTEPLNPKDFAFFKGVNGAAVNGVVSAEVTLGLPAGVYRCCSINSSANHQPVIVPIAQHGSLDDCIYFTAV